ncbi:MAG: hypothetical protein IPM49_03525 [Flavobacteriales bacterium]|nr:hypothetical protein [Flavobacteriales bacterium]
MLAVLILLFLFGTGFLLANHGLAVHLMLRLLRPDLHPLKAVLLSTVLSIMLTSLVLYLGFWLPAEEVIRTTEATGEPALGPAHFVGQPILLFVQLLVGVVSVAWAGGRAMSAIRRGDRRGWNLVGVAFLAIHALVIVLVLGGMVFRL